MKKTLVLLAVPLVLQMVCLGMICNFWLEWRAFSVTAVRAKEYSAATANIEGLFDKSAAILRTGLSSSGNSPAADYAIDFVVNECSNNIESLRNDQAAAFGLARKANVSTQPLEDEFNRQLLSLTEAERAYKVGENAACLISLSEFENQQQKFKSDLEKVGPVVEYPDPQRIAVAVVGLLAGSVLLGVVGMGYASVTHRQRNETGLRTLIANAERFARRQPLLDSLEGDDEFSDLDCVFREMANTITAADRQKEDYLAMIAHDLRTPLSSINGSLTMLAEEGLGEKIPERSLEVICRTQANAARLVNLINDLLNLETIQAGKITIQLDNIPLAYVFESTLETMGQIARQKSVVLEMPETELDVYGDGDRLVQVMTNLLSNAVRYSQPGDAITITAAAQTSGQAEIRVTDRGPGIPPEKLDSIFDKFEQAQKVTLNSWGLGLAICKEIVGLHNGRIGVESELGKGSTFWFCIPLSRNAPPSQVSAISQSVILQTVTRAMDRFNE